MNEKTNHKYEANFRHCSVLLSKKKSYLEQFSINHLIKQWEDQNTVSRGGFRTRQTSRMEPFSKIVNDFKAKFQLTNLLKYSLIYIFQLFSTWDSLLKNRSGAHFTWLPGVKWIFLRIFSCIMKLQQYSSELRENTRFIPRTFCFSYSYSFLMT